MGAVRPGDIGGILNAELQSREAESTRSIKAVEMISDAFKPGSGDRCRSSGYYQYDVSHLEDPESVGYKVAAALSGTLSWGSSWPTV